MEISGKSSADFKTNLGKPEGGDAAWSVGSSGQGDDLCSSECLQQLRILHPVSHRSCKEKGMTDEMFGELMAVVGMANETNRLVNGFQVDLDEALRD